MKLLFLVLLISTAAFAQKKKPVQKAAAPTDVSQNVQFGTLKLTGSLKKPELQLHAGGSGLRDEAVLEMPETLPEVAENDDATN